MVLLRPRWAKSVGAKPSSGDVGPEAEAEAEDGPSSALEAALEAWLDCEPDGCLLPESALPKALQAASRSVPKDGSEAPEASRVFAELFSPREAGPPLFQSMLKAQGGQVHFLHFWRAFSRASQLLAGAAGRDGAASDGLALELETLRDGVLRLLEAAGEDQAAGHAPAVTAESLAEAVHVAAAMSESPGFWRSVEEALAGFPRGSELSLEDVTITILQWLRAAIAWQHSEVDAVGGEESLAKARGLPVLLHIYDVSQEDSVHKLNKWLAHRRSPVKFGGIFHAGVEVTGLEWSFGMSLSDTMTGVSCCEPRCHPAHRFRQTVRLRRTDLTGEEIADLISQLLEEYPGDDYDLLRRNCCHFADEFAQRLGAGRIPRWVHRLARVGARVDSLMQAVSGRKLLPGTSIVEDYSDSSGDE